jgi:large subunit ribosomal protein L9
MEVILLQDVEKVGLRGEVVDVARGYARNFLLPRRLAETATPAKVAELAKRAGQRARQEASTFEQARELGARLEATELRFDVKAGPTGSLFGSVTATDLADEIWRVAKIRVDRRKIGLGDPIKKVGRYEVPIELFTDVTVDLQTVVVSEGQASDTDATGADVSNPEVSDPVEPVTPPEASGSEPAPESEA